MSKKFDVTFNYIDFTQKNNELRLAIENAVANLLRLSEKTVIDLKENETIAISVLNDGELEYVNSVVYFHRNVGYDIKLILEYGEEMDLTDCTTEEMIDIYNKLFN